MPFVKALLHEDVTDFDATFDDAMLNTHVDDCVQLKAGTFAEVSDTLIRGAIKFHAIATKLKLVVSPKSCVVTSSCKLSKYICQQLAESGIKISRDVSTRDLGISFNAGRRTRQPKLAASRMRGVKSRANKIAALSRSVRAARKLYTSGCLLYTSDAADE